MALSGQQTKQYSDIHPQTDLLTEFKGFYERFSANDLDTLGDIYTDNVTFSDPVHTISGLSTLESYFKEMCGNLSHCHFEFKDEIVNDGHASLKWEMHYRHPSLKSNKSLVLSGVSLIHYSDKVYKHEDYYDMGAMLYEHLPLIGGAIRMIKSRLTK